MAHSFNQFTGIFTDGKDGSSVQSYSRFKGEKDQTKKDLGPIPEGKYTVGNTCKGPETRCNLIPDPSTNTFGRSAFQIHGDDGKNDQSASKGCVILNQKDRANLKAGDTFIVKK